MFQILAVYGQNLLDHVEVVVLLDVEDVVADQLIDQILPQPGIDLQRVDSKAKQHFDQIVLVLLRQKFKELGLVFLHHRLDDQLFAFELAVVDNGFVVLAQ